MTAALLLLACVVVAGLLAARRADRYRRERDRSDAQAADATDLARRAVAVAEADRERWGALHERIEALLPGQALLIRRAAEGAVEAEAADDDVKGVVH